MAPLPVDKDPTDIPVGASIRRPSPDRPFVTMSSRKRWSACELSAVLPQVKTASGPKAEEGTAAHLLAEHFLGLTFGNPDGSPYVGHMPDVEPPAGLEGFDYTPAGIAQWHQAALKYADVYATKTAELFADCAPGTTICQPEYKVEDVVIHGVKVYTVADVVAWNATAKRLVVGDYKFGSYPVGMGTAQYPNEQVAGAIVLLIAHAGLPAQTLGGFVYQPRIRPGAGEPWQVLAPLNLEWAEAEYNKLCDELARVAHAAAEMAQGRLVDAKPGDHCSFCPSARWCPAAAEYGHTAIAASVGEVSVMHMDPTEVMALWAARSAFKAFEEDLRERVRILAERHDPAVQVFKRTGNSIWKDPAKAAELLMLHDRFDLLQPAAIKAVMAAGLPDNEVKALIGRAPDVLTFKPSAGADMSAAAAAFAQLLKGKA